MTKNTRFSYKATGVDLEKTQRLVQDYQTIIDEEQEAEKYPGVHSKIGGFASLFSLADAGFSANSLLVSSVDGVGTKLELAHTLNAYSGIGQDLVAMCVNDIITTGAKPLFFLDYLAAAKLEPQRTIEIVRSIAKACTLAGCSLIGGESAEMPGFYTTGAYDLAGFCVGAVEKENLISSDHIIGNEILIGFASSGFHANGFSLIRKIIEDKKINLQTTLPETQKTITKTQKTIGALLLEPTHIYTHLVSELQQHFSIHGLAHISGGSFEENIPRMLPPKFGTILDTRTWDIPPIISFICNISGIETREAYRTFNMGIGLVGAFSSKEAKDVIAISISLGIPAYEIGKVNANTNHCELLL